MSSERDPGETRRIGRRELLVGTVTVGAAVAATGSAGCAPTPHAEIQENRAVTATPRMPVAYIPHGGGPWPFVDLGMGDPASLDRLASYLRELKTIAPTPPRAVLVVSAHWEERVPTVMTAARPPMLYDYYGFPPEAYTITWPAPGDPPLAARVRELLRGAGIASAEEPERGFDHGTFVPLKLTFPDADVPTVQLSLVRGLDPEAHLAIGRELAPLRDEGVLIVGSGMSYHNMRGFGSSTGRRDSETFDAWLQETLTAEPGSRDERLSSWDRAPAARACHPREEHLLPLMVIAGAAGADRGRIAYSDEILGTRVSAAHFG